MTNIYSEYASISKVAGALFYYRPDDYEQYGIEQILSHSLDVEGTPLQEQFNLVLEQFHQFDDKETLSLLHDKYFAAIHGLNFPPWGSVYLDKDRILFGKSTAEYKDFLIMNGFEFDTKDPLDHIGLMLMVLGELLEAEDLPALQKMLGYHLLPWSNHYLSQLRQELSQLKQDPSQLKQELSQNPYIELIVLSEQLLNDLQQQLSITIETRQVYIHVE